MQGGKEEMVDMVAKADFDKLMNEVSELKSQQEKLKKEKEAKERELEQAQLEILDPNFIAYKESLRSGNISRDTKNQLAAEGIDVDNLSGKELVELVSKNVLSELTKEFGPIINKISSDQRQMSAYIEYDNLQKKYGKEEVEQYKDSMQEIFKYDKASRYTFEDAYLLAKQQQNIKKSEEQKAKEAKAMSEKPGASGSDGLPKTFKSAKDAAEDAWEKTMGGKETL